MNPGAPAQPPHESAPEVGDVEHDEVRLAVPEVGEPPGDEGMVGVPALAGRALLVEQPAGGLRGRRDRQVEHEPAQLAAPVERE